MRNRNGVMRSPESPLDRVRARFGPATFVPAPESPTGTPESPAVRSAGGEVASRDLTSIARWDSREGERSLAVLRAAIREAEATAFGGEFPPAVARVMQVWVEVGEGYVRDQARLRASGWDPLTGLRNLPSAVAETVANWRLIRGAGTGKPKGGGR